MSAAGDKEPSADTDGPMVAFDAECANCNHVHIIWVDRGQSRGDVVKIAHNSGRHACGRYCDHLLIRRLSTLGAREKRVNSD